LQPPVAAAEKGLPKKTDPEIVAALNSSSVLFDGYKPDGFSTIRLNLIDSMSKAGQFTGCKQLQAANFHR
jgi:hypothetical protein